MTMNLFLCLWMLAGVGVSLAQDPSTAPISSTSHQDGTCPVPKPKVPLGPDGNITVREYIVGGLPWHVALMEYLTDLLGNEFDPPISFTRRSHNDYLGVPLQESRALGFDFMLANAYNTACYETEAKAVSLANMVGDSINGFDVNITQYGAVLYVHKNRTDIQTLNDLKGRKLGTNKITNLATHLCYDILLRHGIHHLQDPEQVIFFKNSGQAMEALMAGKVDVGCAATATLEKKLSPEDFAQIRILNPQNHTVETIEGGLAPFPFSISSPLVPSYQFLAFPHVPWKVQMRVQEELLAISEHADVAPSLLACLEGKGCFQNNTACLEECFQELPAGSFRNCDTTPQLALSAFAALRPKMVAFTKPQNNFRLRDIQETTGFLTKKLDPNQPQCVRMTNIVDAVTCPPGHFVRTNQEIHQQCNASGLACYDRDCLCSPCVKAFEVDFFPVDDVLEEDGNRTLSGSGSGCSKFSRCGQVPQGGVLSFRAIDNKKRANATMSGAILLADETEEPFYFTRVDHHFGDDGSAPSYDFTYDFDATGMTVGSKTIKIRINDEEIPESPFRIVILKRDCAADTGDSNRVPDEHGECVCGSGTVEMAGKCVSLAILIPSIVVPLVGAFLVAVWLYVRYQQAKADSIWKVDPSEIHFEDPPKVLGRGTFGLVVLAEFRGCDVACKRVLPPNMRRSVNGTASIQPLGSALDDVEKGPAPRRSSSAGMESLSPACTSAKGVFAKSKVAKKMSDDFVKEMRLLSKLRHPSITTVMGAVLNSTSEPMMLMEYMHFGSLYDLLHNESVMLEGEVLVGMLQHVVSGLRFLHASDPLVLHGDLKSQNILVDNKFRAKVADFGLSRKGSLRKDKARGTAYWMAPELLRQESTNTMATDIYAMGIVFYEVFSRQDPYFGEDYHNVLRDVASKVMQKRPPVPKNCPPEAAGMMKACLKEDPSQRPTATDLDVSLRLLDASDIKTFDVTSRRTDMLLEDMFPSHIAQALKEGRKVEPETHDMVTIVFSDIVGYTDISSKLSATKVSDLLDRLYNKFDSLVERLEIFKVETIGDAYMCVTNLCKEQPDHASLAARYAIEAMRLASTVPIDVDDPSAGYVKLRMGFHSGPVVTHVIGTKNARFTLIGDTVNTSSRMESNSLAGRIQCSESTFQLLPTDHPEFQVAERGVIQVKGKGEMKTLCRCKVVGVGVVITIS